MAAQRWKRIPKAHGGDTHCFSAIDLGTLAACCMAENKGQAVDDPYIDSAELLMEMQAVWAFLSLKVKHHKYVLCHGMTKRNNFLPHNYWILSSSQDFWCRKHTALCCTRCTAAISETQYGLLSSYIEHSGSSCWRDQKLLLFESLLSVETNRQASF